MSLVIEKDVSLKPFCTLGIGGKARYFCVVSDRFQLRDLIKKTNASNISLFVIGRGSNLLFSDEEFDGLVVINRIHHIEYESDVVRVGSGYSFAHLGIMINAQFSSELLESIFMPSSPIHDGAVIIRDGNILAAASILPLAQNIQQLKKSIGTRHRAGLGISEITDSLVVVISEETGKVSIAREGIMTTRTRIFGNVLLVVSMWCTTNQIKIAATRATSFLGQFSTKKLRSKVIIV